MLSIRTDFWHVGLVLGLLSLVPAARAQSGPGGTGTTVPPIVGGAPFLEAWVDPCLGVDPPGAPSGLVGCPDQPFRTINAAIVALSAVASLGSPGIVHANPGVYGPVAVGGNGESFPIRMRDYVNVQGVGAKRCVVRGDSTQTIDVFYPRDPDCQCGVREFHEVLVDFSFIFANDYEEFFDGFTLQGGEVQVYVNQEADLHGRVSNCLFDMLDHTSPFSEVGVPGPNFGVLMVSIFHPFEMAPPVPGYFDNVTNILNNTFIQAWAPVAGFEFTARPDSVAICDVNDPLCGNPTGEDPDPTLRGVGSPNIQNNLIRYCEAPRTPLIGVDLTDVLAFQGGVLVPSNAFDPTLPGSVPGVTDITGTFCSNLINASPVPAVNPIPATGGIDPGFVGEMLSSLFAVPLATSRDWRVLPDSVVINQGVAPLGGVLAAANGLGVYSEPTLLPESSFDFDGEVYGNLRIVAGAPDIGFDEFEVLIAAGGYGNDTRTYEGPAPAGCPGTPGSTVRGFLFSGRGSYSLFQTLAFFGVGGPPGVPPACPAGYWWAFSTQFGTLVPPAPSGTSLIWIQFPPMIQPWVAFLSPGTFPVLPLTGYSPPCDPGTLHSFGVAADNNIIPGSGVQTYLNEQLVFTPTGQAPVSSNLQCSYDG